MKKNYFVRILTVMLFLGLFIHGNAQTFTYTSNGLTIEVTAVNPCDVAISNGLIKIKLISSASGTANVVAITRKSSGYTILPNFNLSTSGVDTYTYVPLAPQNDLYDFIVSDPSTPSDVINTFNVGDNINGVTLTLLNTITIGTGTVTNNTNCLTPNGQVAATVSGGSAGPNGSFSYTWTSDNAVAGFPATGTWNGVGSLSLATVLGTTGLPKGTYSLLLEDNFSTCSASKNFTITDDRPNLYNLTTTTPSVCLNNSATLQLSNSDGAQVTYTVFENGFSTGIQKTGTNAVLTFSIPGIRLGVAGTYSYTIKATSGVCETKLMNGTANVIVSTAVVLTSATPTNPLCPQQSNGSITVVAAGGSGTYQYSKDGGLTFSAASTFSALPAGSYNIVVKDNAGCISASTNVVLTDPTQPTITSTIYTPESCPGLANASIFVVASGGTPGYEYSGNNGANYSPSPTLTNLAPGTYQIVVKDANNCKTNSTAVVVTGKAPIALVSTPTNPTTCNPGNEGMIDLSATGGTGPYTFNFNGGGFSSTTNYASLTAGTYSIEVKDVNGCSPDPVDVALTAASVTFTVQKTLPTCNGDTDGIIIFSATGGDGSYSYSLDNGINFLSAIEFTGLSANTYLAKVKDNSGCEKSESIELGEPAVLSYNKATVDASCTNNDGSVSITSVSGGTLPYSFEFDNQPLAVLPANGIFSGLSEGIYTFTISDNLGCIKTEDFTISKPASITTSTAANSPDCTANGTNGSIDLVVVTPGGFQAGISNSELVPPSNFVNITSTGTETYQFSNLRNGIYFITVKNEALCPDLIPVTVSGGPEAVDYSFRAINKLCYEDQASIELSAFQGYMTLPFTCEIRSGGNIITTKTISPAEAQGKVSINISSDGNYEIALFQDQSAPTGCPLPFYADNQTFNINSPLAPLDTISTTIQISLPEVPTGTLSGVVLESRSEPYEVKLELITPESPGNSFFSDFRPVQLDPTNSFFEFNYSSLYAGLYTLSLKDDLGCLKTYPLFVGADPTLIIPNIFTPNGDNINDTFFIRNLPPQNQLIITNRWGGKVYETNNYKNDWSAKGLPDGIYYYKVRFSGKTFNGWLEVLSDR